MNVVVVGGGAVGTLLAWVLARGGAAVTMLPSRTHAGAGPSTRELTVHRGVDRLPPAKVRVASSPDDVGFEPDLAVVAVKAYDLELAARGLPGWPGSTIVTVQNGIGSEERAMSLRPASPVLAASLTASVDFRPDGSLRWLRRGGIGVASARGAGAMVGRVAGLFDGGGLPSRAYPDFRAMKWSKLAGNLVANASGALLDMTPAEIYADHGLYGVERRQLREAFAVMAAHRLAPVALPGADVRLLRLVMRLPAAIGRPIMTRVVRSARGGKEPSLRLGLAGGAPRSEVRWLNGAVAAAGATVGVATPVNATLTALVEAALTDPAIRDQYRGRPDRLVAAIASSE